MHPLEHAYRGRARLTDRALRTVAWMCFLAAGLVLILTGACEMGLL